MNIGWLESILISLISGFAEFLPISAQAHRSLLQLLLGGNGNDPLFTLVIHIAALVALILHTKEDLSALHREMKLAAIPLRRRKRQPDRQAVLDIAHIRFVTYFLIAAFLFYPLSCRMREDLGLISLFLLVNGIVLYIPQHLPGSNKDSRSMTKLDGIFTGIAAAASILPGISLIGGVYSAGVSRGADGKNALKWALLLSIPAIAFLIGFDISALIVSGAGLPSVLTAIQCLLCGIAAFAGAYFAIVSARFLAQNAGFSGFSYYCWGAAFFSFILYLTT